MSEHDGAVPLPEIETLAEVATRLESLRQPNPINGDGSNYMLTRCLNELVALAGSQREVIVDAVQAVRDQRAAEDRVRYERLCALNTEEADRG